MHNNQYDENAWMEEDDPHPMTDQEREVKDITIILSFPLRTIQERIDHFQKCVDATTGQGRINAGFKGQLTQWKKRQVAYRNFLQEQIEKTNARFTQ